MVEFIVGDMAEVKEECSPSQLCVIIVIYKIQAVMRDRFVPQE
jgi:hypothetical protein